MTIERMNEKEEKEFQEWLEGADFIDEEGNVLPISPVEQTPRKKGRKKA